MTKEGPPAAAWYGALALRERMAPTMEPSDPGDGHEVAARRLERWRATQALVDDKALHRRLESDGLDEAVLLRLLAARADEVRPRTSCHHWINELSKAYEDQPAAEPGPCWTPGGDHPMRGFLGIVAPLVGRAADRLKAEAEKLTAAGAPFDPQVVLACALAEVEPRLITLVARCLVLELHVRRLSGRLKGATADERFDDFCRQLSRPAEAVSFLRRYPVLARQIVTLLDNWVVATVEFLGRVRDDADTLATFSLGKPLGPLVDFTFGQGDHHRGGRSVAILTFSFGVRVVYKPRSLAAELHFQDLLRWVADREPVLAPRTLRIVDRGTYGWAEFVAAAPCSNLEQVQRFYRRQGCLLALLYLLEGADLHHENLFAVGDQPVLIDLEALFHRPADSRALTAADKIAGVASVLDSGLLPAFVGSVDLGVDLSGLGANPGQVLPGLPPHWQYAGTDRVRVVRRPVTLTEAQHRPMHAGRLGDPREHAEAIAAGFAETYRLLATHRAQLLAADGPIMAFADDLVRVVLRPTRTYERMIDESHHPDLMSDAIALEGHTNRLWDKIEQIPYLADVVVDERDDVERGDIPIFTTRPAALDLWTSAGRTVKDFFTESGVTRALRRIDRLGETDLAEQLWLLRTSLAPRFRLMAESEKPDGTPDSLGTPGETPDRDALVQAACVVGDRILDLACDGPNPTWYGMRADPDGISRPGPLGTSLYDGSAGLALFLAMLGKVAKDDRYTHTAHAAVDKILRQSEGDAAPLVGGYLGAGGTVYVLTALARLWSDERFLDAADTKARYINEVVANDDELDVMGGAAGAIMGLLPLAQLHPQGPALRAAVRCGEHLLRHSRVMPEGCGWPSARADYALLGGLSHGAGGIAMALLELAHATGQDRFALAADAGLAYERTTFRADLGNWLDLRDGLPSPSFGSRPRTMTAWCHGATGVGMSRLVMLRHRSDDALRDELDTAVETTLREGFGSSHSLCHGDMGSLELLLLNHLAHPEATSAHLLMTRAAGVIASIDRTGVQCGNPVSVESPDLMTGIAGIGYQLLRLAEPATVPAVLTLSQARQDGGSLR